MSDLGAFANGDHTALFWHTVVRTGTAKKNERQLYDYSKADIVGMRQELQTIDWQTLFGASSAEESWSTFKSKIHKLESQYVPVKTTRSFNSKPLWMTHKTLKAVKHRHKVHRKYKENNHPACKRADKAASRAVSDSRRNFEKMLATKIKDDNKSFSAYVRSKTKSKAQVGPLRNTQGQEINDAEDMAESFNAQFVSVFTAEDTSYIPVPDKVFHGVAEDKSS